MKCLGRTLTLYGLSMEKDVTESTMRITSGQEGMGTGRPGQSLFFDALCEATGAAAGVVTTCQSGVEQTRSIVVRVAGNGRQDAGVAYVSQLKPLGHDKIPAAEAWLP